MAGDTDSANLPAIMDYFIPSASEPAVRAGGLNRIDPFPPGGGDAFGDPILAFLVFEAAGIAEAAAGIVKRAVKVAGARAGCELALADRKMMHEPDAGKAHFVQFVMYLYLPLYLKKKVFIKKVFSSLQFIEFYIWETEIS